MVSIRSKAKSDASSCTRILAGNSRPSDSATVISLAFRITWALVTARPSASRITPDPNEFSRRFWANPIPPPMPLKNCEKTGSLAKGDTFRVTTRFVKILITEGLICFTTGANDREICCWFCGTSPAANAAKGREAESNKARIYLVMRYYLAVLVWFSTAQ